MKFIQVSGWTLAVGAAGLVMFAVLPSGAMRRDAILVRCDAIDEVEGKRVARFKVEGAEGSYYKTSDQRVLEYLEATGCGGVLELTVVRAGGCASGSAKKITRVGPLEDPRGFPLSHVLNR